jgi:MinD-like ATPase involved in chromosome partitioning or flagellar assembly
MTDADRHTDIAKLCQMDPQILRPTYLRQNLPMPRQWGFYLVPGIVQPWQYRELTTNQLGGVLQSIHAAFDNVLIDLGRNLGALEFLAMDYCDHVGLVFTPGEVGVRSAMIYKEAILRHGLSQEAILYLTNRPIATGSMSVAEIESTIGRQPDLSLSNLGNDLHLTLSLHTPYPLRFPDESGTRQLEKFTRWYIEHENAANIDVDQVASQNAP